MRKLLLFITVLITFASKAQTSTYFPFPDSGIVWRQEGYIQGNSCCCTGSGPCLREDNYEYFLNGDTLIGAFIYKKLLQTGIGQQYIVGPPSCPPWCSSNYEYYYYNNNYVGCIRQDTGQRKVFFLPPNFSQDTLLYDFNLNVGDTLPSLWTNYYPSNYVSAIDSILIGNNYHKRFWISLNNDSNYISLIEGIGSSYGLLSPLFSNLNVSLIYNLLICVTINNMTVYPDSFTTCQLIDKINYIRTNSALTISPNPFSEILNIKLNDITTFEIILYDVASRKLFQQTFTNSAAINTSQLAKGIYIYVVKSKNEVIKIGKVVKE